MRWLILLAVLTVTCAVIGCSGGGNNDEAPAGNAPPEKPPIGWDDQADRDWLYRSQYKAHMRHMWIDCNRIVSAGRGDLEPTWYEIESAASDIRRRAGDFAGFWSEIDEAGGLVLECAEDNDRIGASKEFKRLGAACDGCHLASWSPAYLHVTGEEIDNWRKNIPSTPGMSEVMAEPPPAIPNRKSMQDIFFHYQMVELRLQKWEVADLKESMSHIRPEAAKRAARWRTVETSAGTILDLANKRKRDGMKDAYNAMTNACLACHGEQAGGLRDIMLPMPWDGPVK
jgi:cytochrome c556